MMMSVDSYPAVDGNFSEKGNGDNADDVKVSDNDSNPSYLFSEDTQNLEKEKEQGVEILGEDNGGEISIDWTLDKKSLLAYILR